jgi:hypothetical protein
MRFIYSEFNVLFRVYVEYQQHRKNVFSVLEECNYWEVSEKFGFLV